MKRANEPTVHHFTAQKIRLLLNFLFLHSISLKSDNSVESILAQKKRLEAKVFSGEVVKMVNRHFLGEIIIDKQFLCF